MFAVLTVLLFRYVSTMYQYHLYIYTFKNNWPSLLNLPEVTGYQFYPSSIVQTQYPNIHRIDDP